MCSSEEHTQDSHAVSHDESLDSTPESLTRRQALKKLGLVMGACLVVPAALAQPAAAQNDSAGVMAACTHSWYYTNIMEIKDTGSDSTHRIFGQQRCSKCGATRNATTYESHKYVWTWQCYYKYTASQHEYKKEYVCSTCNHKKNVSTYLPHQWESIYDTKCDLCGQTR